MRVWSLFAVLLFAILMPYSVYAAPTCERTYSACTGDYYLNSSSKQCDTCPTGQHVNSTHTGCDSDCSTSKACSSSFSGYSGTYNECTQNQSSKCYKSCTISIGCNTNATCGTGYTCTYNSDTCSVSNGTQYYGGSCSGGSGTCTCSIKTKTCNTVCTSVANRTSRTCTPSNSVANAKTTSCPSGTQTCGGNYTSNGCSSAGASCDGCSSWGSCSTSCVATSCNEGYYLSGGQCKPQSDLGSGYYCPAGNKGASECYKSCTKTCTGKATCPSNATCSYNTSSYTTGTEYYGGSCSASSSTCPVSSWYCNANHYKEGSSCSACNVSFTDSTSCTYTVSITGGTKNYTSGTKSRTCYHQTSDAGSTSSSQCTGTQSCGSYGSCSGGSHTSTTCSAGYYKNTDNTCKQCEAGYYCPGGTWDVSSSIAGRSSCEGGTYSGAGASSCSSCPTAYPNSGAGATAITSCYSNTKSRAWTGSQTPCSAPNGCSSVTCNSCSGSACDYVAYSNANGNGDGTIKSGCSTNNASCQQTVKSVTAKANYYANVTSCPACPTKYPNSAAGADKIGKCYLTLTAGQQVASVSAGASDCSAGRYCTSTGNIYYNTDGGTATYTGTQCVAGSYSEAGASACTACGAGKTSTAGATSPGSCANCTAITNLSTWAITSWNNDNTMTNLCTVGTCQAGAYKSGNTCPVCAVNTYSSAGATSCVSCLPNYKISGTSRTDHDSSTDCKITCNGGSYLKTVNDTVCTDVGEGYWAGASNIAQGSSGSRTACASGKTTIGYGAGADEAGDCGNIYHVGNGKIYLRSERKTIPSLNFDLNNDGIPDLYGNMSSSAHKMSAEMTEALKIKIDNTTYYIHDDSAN